MTATQRRRTACRTRTPGSTAGAIPSAQIKTRATFIAGRRFRGAMVILVRFGELALKSPYVRRQLRDRLVANIQDLFAAEGVEGPTRAGHRPGCVDVDDVPPAS